MNKYHVLIKEICDELNIKFKILSKDLVIMLEKDGKIKYITGFKFDINTQGTSNIIDDKYAFYEILKEKNVPIIDHKIIYSPKNNNEYAIGCNTYEYVYNFFRENNNHIVIKSNTGTCGSEVFEIKTIEDIDYYLDRMFLNNRSLSICSYYDIENEYRTIVFNNKILLIYKKIKPVVIGDGTSSIRELLLKFNPIYFKDKLKEIKFDRVLKENEKYEYNWQFNLSKGAKIGTTDELIKKEIESLALKVSSIVNLEFGSVDIIKTKDNKLYVIEANSGVMMTNYIEEVEYGYNVAKDIYKKVILEMLK